MYSGELQVNTSLNSTPYDIAGPINPPVWDTICLGVIAPLAFLGNGIVVLVIACRRSLRKHASPNWFVLSLAVADLCVGGLYAPSHFICVMSAETSCSKMTWDIIHYLQSVFLSASVTNLCVLTFDRYIAVVHPFTYQNKMRSSSVFKLIQLAWLSAVLLNIPLLVLQILPKAGGENTVAIHVITHMIVFAFIPSAFMIYTYIAIFLVVRRHKLEIERQEMQLAANFQLENSVHRHTKDGTMKAVGVIVLLFIVCSSLYQWLTLCNLLESCRMTSRPVYFIIFILLHFKSAINVVVYALLRRDFQRELKMMFKCQ